MSSVTGNIDNKTDLYLTIIAGAVQHGDAPEILKANVPAHTMQADVFVANSSGAGVEGDIIAKGADFTWTLHYDNPVVGDNSCGISPPTPTGCQAGSGTNAVMTYTIEQNK